MSPLLFDVSRLYIRKSLASATGIDRVTEAYGKWLLAEAGDRLIPVCSWGGFLWPMSRASLAKVIGNRNSRAGISDKAWNALLADLQGEGRGSAALRASPGGTGTWKKVATRYLPAAMRTFANWRPAAIPRGALYLNVSHYGLEQHGLLEHVAARGARSVALIHDLIPIKYPEYCSPLASRWHHRRIEAVLRCAELVITNSATTADDLRQFAASSGQRLPPIRVAPLGLEAAFSKSRILPDALPYFVCVGTIEPRKNLTLLLRLWRELAQRWGAKTPKLVLIGQRGWEIESVLDYLERAPALQHLVHEASGLSDEQAAFLIANAAALLSPSFEEGFNLPVSEALALGTPVIASDIRVHRELAGGAALIHPLDGPAWLRAIENAAATRVRNSPRPAPRWEDHFALVASALDL